MKLLLEVRFYKMSSDGNLVSVIIPVFNREMIVEATLLSVLASSYRPIELILINDGSGDNTLSVLKTFKEKNEKNDFQIIIIDQLNFWAPFARNIWFWKSQGKYIQFLDSDDLIHKDKFTIQVKQLKNHSCDFALCDFETKFIDSWVNEFHSNEKKLLKIIMPCGSFGSGSILLKRDLANKVSWNIKLHQNQDMDYFLRSALIADKIVYTNDVLYYYIMHSGTRISNIYSKSIPALQERVESLMKTKVRYKNIFAKYFSLLWMWAKLIFWYSLNNFAKIWKKPW